MGRPGLRILRHGAGRHPCDADAVGAFVATLAGYQFKTVEQKLCALRSFLRFASGDGLVDAAVLAAVATVKSRKHTRIPSTWDPAEVTRIRDAVDRGNPSGKRDYTITLLVIRLRLRSIDVQRLEFSDFDWPRYRLSIVQAKTGRLASSHFSAAVLVVNVRGVGVRRPVSGPGHRACHLPDG